MLHQSINRTVKKTKNKQRNRTAQKWPCLIDKSFFSRFFPFAESTYVSRLGPAAVEVVDRSLVVHEHAQHLVRFLHVRVEGLVPRVVVDVVQGLALEHDVPRSHIFVQRQLHEQAVRALLQRLHQAEPQTV